MSYSISKKITQTVASLSLVAFFASVSQVALADDSAAVKPLRAYSLASTISLQLMIRLHSPRSQLTMRMEWPLERLPML